MAEDSYFDDNKSTDYEYHKASSKPEPAIYELECGRLSVDVSAAVFVGDGGSDELCGADAVGLKAIWAMWYIETWPWERMGNVAETSDMFPRCRRVCDLPAFVDSMYA